jgi:hypothetical protein
MFRAANLISTALRLFVAALLLAGVASPAGAQVRAFKISGSGIGPVGLPLPGDPPRYHWNIGQGTELGRYFGEGKVKTDTAIFDLGNHRIYGEFGSGAPFVFTAANGDKLVTWFGNVNYGATKPGTYELTVLDFDPATGQFLVNAKWVAEFVVQPGNSTGRFAGVTGSWIMYAQTDKPFLIPSADNVYYSWQGEGRLKFPKP